MPLLTYRDRAKAAPVVRWRGRRFSADEPVALDREADPDLVEAARANPFFDVDEDAAPAPPVPPPGRKRS